MATTSSETSFSSVSCSMATTSSQTSFSSVSTPTLWDVFLSFRGLDTRHKFTSDLYTALDSNKVRIFMDDPELHTGEVILEALFRGIKESKTYIVVFSEDYASSRWCLEELVEIYNFHETKKRLIVPVYYYIDPSVVRHQTGSFKNAFEKHQTRFDIKIVEKWRLTLKTVAAISGITIPAERSEPEIVNEIVDMILRETKCKNVDVAKYPVGLDSRVRHITSWFAGCREGVIRIGIYGMGGVGKTTLAKALYNQLLLDRFRGVCFLENVREKLCTSKGLESLQQKLINDVLKRKKTYEVPSVGEGTKFIRERFCSAKVLLILDDIDNLVQYESLVGPFASGSVVIITTRDEEVLDKIEVEPRYRYRVEELDDDESLELFTKHAFGNAEPDTNLKVLSKDILRLASGLPLALIVFGAYLFKRPEVGWKSYIQKLKRNPDNNIQQKLIISLDTLEWDDPEMKKIFLDIACLFIGKKKEAVVKIMETYYSYVDHIIDILRKRCLLTINDEDELSMHDLLRDMGRELARNNSHDEPGKHSRLWVSKDILDVLKNQKGTEAIEGIIYKEKIVSNKDTLWGMSFDVETFKRMRKLRFLHLDNVNLTGSFEHAFEDLRWLCWDWCPLEYFPPQFYPQKLVILELIDSKIRKMWELDMASHVFENLKTLTISHNYGLTTTPDFTMSPYLENLNFEFCSSLIEVHISVGSLKRLVSLNLHNCKNLKSLPDKICNLRALKSLNIAGCSSLKALPTQLGNLTSLTELVARRLTVSNLPDSIGYLCKLVELNLNFNENLETLPNSICNLRSLEVLDLYKCSRLEVLPRELGRIESLKKLVLGGLTISNLPKSIGCLSRLVELELCYNSKLKTLPDSICNLRALEVLNISGCSSLEALPIEFGNIESLKMLNAQGLTILKLPDSVGRLSKLVKLRLCENENLVTLPDNVCTLRSLELLDITSCKKLEMLPDQLCKVTRLKKIYARYVPLVKQIPCISQLLDLELLDISGCCYLLSIAELPPYLKRINAEGCRSIVSLPDLSNLKQLEELDLYNCSSLREIQGLEELASLKVLHLTGCNSSLLADIFTERFFQFSSGLGHQLIIHTGMLPDWISPFSNSKELTVSLDLLPNASHDSIPGMHETKTCTEEFMDCNSESSNLEESLMSLNLLPNVSHDFLVMHETNTDTEEFMDCISESCYSEESMASLDLLPNVSHDFLDVHETNTDTEEFPDCISDCYSEESIVLTLDFLSHNIWGLHETNTYQKKFPDCISESCDSEVSRVSSLMLDDGWGHLDNTYPISESCYIPESKMFSNLLPYVSHNFMGMILCFRPCHFSITYSLKSDTSDLIWSSGHFDRNPRLAMVIVPRSIFSIRDGDNMIELTSDDKIILGVHLLYRSEKHLESENN